MARPRKQFHTAAERKAHEARLAKRREKHHESITVRMASEAAEGETDFQALVEAEQDRLKTRAIKGGSQSPKAVSAARENITAAFDLMGGVPALVVWGRTNPTEFYRLWARLIPKEAVEQTTAQPLETLLSQLAEKADKSISEAAIEIGQETLAAARIEVAREDAEAGLGFVRPDGETIN